MTSRCNGNHSKTSLSVCCLLYTSLSLPFLTMTPQSTYLTCTHIPSRYSNSRNYKLSLPTPRIDIFRTTKSFSGAFLCNNLDRQSDLVSHSAPSSENFVHTLKQLHRMDCDRILLGRNRQTVRFSSECHCNDWSFETHFVHP